MQTLDTVLTRVAEKAPYFTWNNLQPRLLSVLVYLLLGWISWELVKLAGRRIVARANDHDDGTFTLHEKRAKTVAQLLKGAGRAVIIVVVLLLSLNKFIDITGLAVSATVVGLAVSFGAQSLVKDFLAGFFILLENQFAVGDQVEAAGKSGIVERLTLRTVTLRDIEGTVHIVPNGIITTLSNKTRGWSRAVVDIAISYDNDIDKAIAALREEAATFAEAAQWKPLLDSPPEVLGVESFTENGVVIRNLLRTHPGKQGEVAREFRRRVMIRLEREGIKGARAQQTIHVHPPAATVTAAPPPGPQAPPQDPSFPESTT